MGYEAQIAGISDNSPFQSWFINKIIKLLKYFSKSNLLAFRKQVVEECKQNNINLSFVNGGGTGSISFTDADPSVTEITVGSAFYSSHLFDHDGFLFEPAAYYAIEVTRNPTNNVYTCHGGGYVASGGCSWDKIPQICFPNNANLRKEECAGEVQTPVICNSRLMLGDIVLMRHSKAGEMCEHFNELVIIESGKYLMKEKTYRGMGLCI